MTVNQVYGIVNSIASQSLGDAAITTTDLSGLISLGKAVLSSDTNKDNFLGVLADRIGKTVLRTLDLSVEFPYLLRNDYEFGAILQKIDIQPLTAQANTSETIGGQNYTPNQFAINKPVVTQTFFTDADTWSYKVTVPDTMFKRAFTSAEAMGAFIDGIMDALEKSMIEGLNYMAHTSVSNFIGEKIYNENAVVNIREKYNTATGKELTKAECLMDADFLKYASMIIKNYIGYLATPKTVFNVAGKKRATQRDNMHVMLLNDFVSASDAFMSAGTFHKDLVELPYFQPVEHWQSFTDVADSVDPGAVDAIDIKTSSGHSVEAAGIIGVICDREAIATGLVDQYTATDRNNSDRYTNYTSGATIQYINDLSENGVIFTIGDYESSENGDDVVQGGGEGGND